VLPFSLLRENRPCFGPQLRLFFRRHGFKAGRQKSKSGKTTLLGKLKMQPVELLGVRTDRQTDGRRQRRLTDGRTDYWDKQHEKRKDTREACHAQRAGRQGGQSGGRQQQTLPAFLVDAIKATHTAAAVVMTRP
jgi:hypothetical protein